MNRDGFDIASFLMDSIRGQPKQATYRYQDLSPLTEHTETVENHVFRVHLPDFRAEDIRVQIDKNSMKLLVRCRKPLAQTTVARVELDLDVPKDAYIEHIKGNFEQGWLSLSMPKKRVTQDPDKKDEEEIPKEKAGSGEKLIPKDKAESEKRKKKEESMPKEEQKKSKEEDMSKETDLPKEKIEKDKTEEKTKADSSKKGSLPEKAESEKRKKKEEPMPKEEPKKSKEEDMSKETDLPKEKIEKDKSEEKTKADSSKEGSLPEDKPTADADNREQECKKQLDKAKGKKDTTEEAPSMHEEKPKACRKRQRRKGVDWRGKIEAMEEWLDGGLVVVDKLMESFENNKKLIYATAVGFSVGFLVSRTLCSRRT